MADGTDEEGNQVLYRLLTGATEVLQGVSAMGHATTAATGNRGSDGLSEADIGAGRLPERFLVVADLENWSP